MFTLTSAKSNNIDMISKAEIESFVQKQRVAYYPIASQYLLGFVNKYSDKYFRENTGVYISTENANKYSIKKFYYNGVEKGISRIRPKETPTILANFYSSVISHFFHLSGETFTFTSNNIGELIAIRRAFTSLSNGRVSEAIVGNINLKNENEIGFCGYIHLNKASNYENNIKMDFKLTDVVDTNFQFLCDYNSLHFSCFNREKIFENLIDIISYILNTIKKEEEINILIKYLSENYTIQIVSS